MLLQEPVFHPKPVGLEWRLVEQMPEALAEFVVAVIRDLDRAGAQPDCALVVLAQWKPSNLGRPASQRLTVEQRLPSALAALRQACAGCTKRHGRNGNEMRTHAALRMDLRPV